MSTTLPLRLFKDFINVCYYLASAFKIIIEELVFCMMKCGNKSLAYKAVQLQGTAAAISGVMRGFKICRIMLTVFKALLNIK